MGMIASFMKQYGLVIGLVLVMIVMDWVTGLICAQVSGQGWDSKKGTRGFWKKMALLCALAFGITLDATIPFLLELGLHITLPFPTPFGLIVGAYIILNESISVCENLYGSNPAIMPGWIVKLLRAVSKQVDRTEPQKEDDHENMD